jgi:hypothetical protein
MCTGLFIGISVQPTFMELSFFFWLGVVESKLINKSRVVEHHCFFLNCKIVDQENEIC